MKYTAGKWIVAHEYNVVVKGTNRGIASCGGYTSNQQDGQSIVDENKANARLVAQAPEMVEILKAKYAYMRRPGYILLNDNDLQFYRQAGKVLAEVEGRK